MMNIMMNAPNLKMMETNLKSIKSLLIEGQRPDQDEVVSDANIITKMMSYSKDMESKQMLRWYLNPHNNFLHETSSFVANYLYSRYMMIIFTSYAVATVILREVAPFWMYITFILVMTWLVFVPWSIASLMSVNKEMIPRIVATIDTWIKMLTMCFAMAYSTIYNIKTSDAPIALLVVFGVSVCINLCLAVGVVSSIDAIHGWGKKARIFLVTLAALYAGFWVLLYRYYLEDEPLHIAALGKFGTISLSERVSSYFEIEAIFLTKQALLAILRGTDRCTAVKYCPYIEWRKTLDSDITLFSRRSVVDPNDLPTKNKSKQKEDGV